MSPDEELAHSVAVLWRRTLIGPEPDGRRHWRTKTAHYRAVAELLAQRPGRAPRWGDVVDAVAGGSSRSTFYDVTGSRATHALIGAYREAAGADAAQIAYRYRRLSAVDQLIDETKVWSFWRYRERWLAHDDDHGSGSAPDRAEFLAGTLPGVVREWALRQPALAAAVGFAPPACAVEDFALVRGGRLPALRAHDLLQVAVAEAVAESTHSPDPPLPRAPALMM